MEKPRQPYYLGDGVWFENIDKYPLYALIDRKLDFSGMLRLGWSRGSVNPFELHKVFLKLKTSNGLVPCPHWPFPLDELFIFVVILKTRRNVILDARAFRIHMGRYTWLSQLPPEIEEEVLRDIEMSKEG